MTWEACSGGPYIAVAASQAGITEGLEVALAEARAAAHSAATDRDTLATSWRREWEAAKVGRCRLTLSNPT